MHSQLIRYFAVGLLAVTLTGAAFVSESSAQWGRFAQPYSVNYNASYYSPGYAVYPAYGVWRPFGGLFAGIHGMLCHKCWLSPCCCVTPVVCDPCFDPCFDPCLDPCYDPCCGYAGGFGYSGYYEQPKSLSLGVPSPTGFGSITPAEGTPGQRPVGVPSVQRPAIPSSGRTLTTSPGTIGSPMSGVPNYNNGQPNLAPPRNQRGFSDPATKIENQLNEIPRREPFDPSVGSSIRSDAANIPPTTGADDEWYRRNSPADGIPPGTGTAPNDGTMPAPQGQGLPGIPDTPGAGIPPAPGSSTHNMNMIDLGTGTISVTVPDNAKVYINGYETKMPGVNRRYVVNDLAPGQFYDYEVRIVALVNGQTVEETQYVTLSAGQQGMVAFGKPQPQSDNTRYVAARPVH